MPHSDCDWPNELFTFRDDPGEHDPCYVVMPGGAILSLNHHAREGVDIARARFIIDACNEKLKRDPWEGKRPNPAQALTSTPSEPTQCARSAAEIEQVLRNHFYTGEPGQHEAIKGALAALTNGDK